MNSEREAPDTRQATFGDDHEHAWELSGARAWVCLRCGGWTHHPPPERAVDAYEVAIGGWG